MESPATSLREKAAPLREKLRQLRARARRHIICVGLSLLALTVTAFTLLSFAADWTLYLERSTRAVLLGAAGIGLLLLAIRRLLLPLRVPLPDDDLALAVEREYPHLGESLINAIQFSEYTFDPGHRVSHELMEAVEDQAREETAGIDFHRTLDMRRVRWRLTAGAGGLLLLGVLAACYPGHAVLWFERTVLLSEEEWPRKTRFQVRGFEEGRIWVPKGGDFTVVAEAAGLIPRRVVIRYRYGSGARQKAVMHRLGRSEFKHDFHRILEPIRFHLRGGDGRTSPLEIEVVDRPSVEDIHFTGRPPPYTRESTRHFPKGQAEIRLPSGSELQISGKATKEIVEAKVRLGEEEHLAELTGARSFFLLLKPQESTPLEIALKDSMDLGDDRPVRLHLRMVKDRPPRLKLRLRGIGDMVTPQAVIPTTVHITDDYGVGSAGLRWRISSAEEEASIPLDGLESGARKAQIPYRWELSPLSLPTGQFLSFQVEALDLDDVAGPNRGSSETYTLKVVTIEELSTELIRRQEEQRRELERIVVREEKERDLLRSLAGGPVDGPEAIRKTLQTLERSQRLAVRQTQGISDRLVQILEEMINNRITELRHARRINDLVIAPLRDLSAGLLQESAEALVAARAAPDPAGTSLLKLADSYDRIIQQMRRILSNMDRIEKFTEVVAILRTILQNQSEARGEVEEAYRNKIEEIFKEF